MFSSRRFDAGDFAHTSGGVRFHRDEALGVYIRSGRETTHAEMSAGAALPSLTCQLLGIVRTLGKSRAIVTGIPEVALSQHSTFSPRIFATYSFAKHPPEFVRVDPSLKRVTDDASLIT